MKTTTYKELKHKSGDIIPEGIEVEVLPLRKQGERTSHPFYCIVLYLGLEYQLFYTDVIEPPSEEEIEEMMFDSICPSVGGYNVEPDGFDPDGFPSWLQAVGIV